MISSPFSFHKLNDIRDAVFISMTLTPILQNINTFLRFMKRHETPRVGGLCPRAVCFYFQIMWWWKTCSEQYFIQYQLFQYWYRFFACFQSMWVLYLSIYLWECFTFIKRIFCMDFYWKKDTPVLLPQALNYSAVRIRHA